MALNRHKSLLILATMLVGLILVSFFGMIASFERSVYTSAIDKILPDLRNHSIDPLPTFTSRPYRCEYSVNYVDKPADPILKVVNEANDQGTRPIPLMAASHLVPIMSWQDNLRLYKAGYLGLSETDLLFVSRVGFDRFFGRAAVCLRRAQSPHGSGVILILERDGFDWSVVAMELIRVAS